MAMTAEQLQTERTRALRRLQSAAYASLDLGATEADISEAVEAGLSEARQALAARQPAASPTPGSYVPEPGSAMAALLEASR